MFAYAGLLADDFGRGFLSPTRIPFMQAGVAHRFNLHFAADAAVVATNKAVIGELGAYYIDRQVQFRVAGIAGSQGTRGASLQIASQGNSRFNFNFDLRHIRPGRRAALDPLWPGPGTGARCTAP